MIRLQRLATLLKTAAEYHLDKFLPESFAFNFIRIVIYLLPWRWQSCPYSRGAALRKALEQLGPVFIKLGQLLSTRRDLLPDDIADELQKLQDQVPPFCSQAALARLEKELQKPLENLFANVDTTPLASGSIAQIHAAELPNGKKVVIKIIRPGIETIIAEDLKLLFWFAALIETNWQEGPRLRPVAVIKEYQQIITRELDLTTEAANTIRLRENFLNSPLLYVPEVFSQYTTANILVMERIYGIPIYDQAALKAAHINFKQLAENGVKTFFTQVFEHNFFHADMHPGNIFVSAENPEFPQYIAVDCAIMGSLLAEDQLYLARQLMAFIQQDYTQIVRIMMEANWIPAHTLVPECADAVRTVCEPILQKPLKDIAFGVLLLNLFKVGRRFQMEVQPQLVLLQKTLFYIEGLGRQLYPELNIWTIGRPLLEKWLRERLGIRATLQSLWLQLPQWREQLPYLPQLTYDALMQWKNYPLLQQAQQQQLMLLQKNFYQNQRRDSTVLISAILLLGLALYPLLPINIHLTQIPFISWIAGISGLSLLGYRLFR